MVKESIVTFKWKLFNGGFNYLYACLLSLFLYFLLAHGLNWIIISFAFVFLLLIIKKPKIILISIAIAGLLFLIHFLTQQKHLDKYINGNYKVIKVFKSGISIKENGMNIFIYTRESFHENDIVHISGQIKSINGIMQNYLYQHNIVNGIFYSKIELVQASHSLKNNFINWLEQGSDLYKRYISLFLLGIKNNLNEDVYKMSIETSVVHLFVISGFHMMIFNFIFTNIFKLLRIKRSISQLMSLSLLLVYLYILGSPLAASRAFIILVFYFVNTHIFNNKFSKITILNTTMILLALINPRGISSLSFILTFMANYSIVIFNYINFKNKKYKLVLFPVFIYLCTLPVIVYINKFISPLGLLWSVILAPVFSVVYTLSIFLFPFKSIMEIIYGSFDFIFSKIYSLNVIINFEYIDLNICLYIYLSLSLIILIITYSKDLKKLIV